MKIISKIISIISLILMSIFIILMFYSNVVPNKYLYPIIIIVLLITIILSILIFKNKAKIISSIILIIMSILYILGSNYFYKAIHLMDVINNNKEETELYYVVVLKDSSYNDIKDINNKEVSMIKEESENFNKALKELKNKVKIKENNYKEPLTLANDLLNKKTDIIFIKNIHKDLYDTEIDGFKDKTKILAEIKIKTKTENISKTVNIKEEPFNVYISGIDAYGDIMTKSQGDVNIIMTVNPNAHEILLTSIPRDYYVQLHGTTGVKDKLTHAAYYGINMSITTLEDLLNTKINHYFRVNFDTLIKVVDAIGGIDVYSDQSFEGYSGETVYIKKGWNHFNGKEALAFSRERKIYATGDRRRGENQQNVLKAIMTKVSTTPALLTNYNEIMNVLNGSFQTDIETNEMTKFIKYQIDKMPSWNIKTYNLNGYNSYNVTYSLGSLVRFVMEPDMKTVEQGSNYINGMLEGKTFNELGL